MGRDHFGKVMRSPYFQYEENQKECDCKSLFCRLENIFVRFFNKNKSH